MPAAEDNEIIIERAHQLQEGGDTYDAAELILPLYQDMADDLHVVWNTIGILKMSPEHREALADILDDAHDRFPEHLHISMEWAKYLRLSGDLTGSLNRLRENAARYSTYEGDRILFLTEQFILLRDLEKWSELLALLETHWNDFLVSDVWIILPAMVFTLSACGLHEKLIEYLTNFKKRHLGNNRSALGIDINNAMTPSLMAIANRKLLQSLPIPVRIISVGQNCLPAYLAARWGLNPEPLDFLPYDQSAFPGDSSAAALESNFAIFRDLSSFVARPFGRSERIAYHTSTGVHFAHNPLPLRGYEPDLEKIVSRFQNRINKFIDITRTGKIVFFANFCGDGDPCKLISSIKKIYGDNSNVFLLNTTSNYFEFNNSENIFILNLPYPHNYSWNSLEHYTSNRGVAFEIQIITNLINKIVQFI